MDKLFAGCNLEFVREDDYVEYFVFPQLPESLVQGESGDAEFDQLRTYLTTVQAQCKAIVDRHIREHAYIWHKDEFQLQVRTGSKKEQLLNDEIAAEASAMPLPPHLHGVIHYGDNIADEWFIVYLLYELTREISGCIARVIDSDGEFLLIEAADVLPKWANPDTCEQRVYITNGGLRLVQNSPSGSVKLMPVATAIAKLQQNPSLYCVPKAIQECINKRLKEFQKPNVSLHRQIVRLPIGVASLLKKRPALVAPAVRAFCDRDSIDMKACRSMRFFPPEQRVRTNVCFTRCLYAMIMHSNYLPDHKVGWKLNGPTNTEQYKEDLLGVKIACGFEILASQAKGAGDVENDAAWRTYMRSLTNKGYFRGNLEGSEQYKGLLAEAKKYFKENQQRFRTAPLVGAEILELLNSTEINAGQLRDEENNLQPSDSDNWLNISAEELDAMLEERFGAKKLYNSNGDINAEDFTKNITEFLEKQSAFDGIDNNSSDDTDDNASANKNTDEFKAKVKKNHSMRRACKQNLILNENATRQSDDELNSTHVRNFLDFVIPEDKWDSNSEMSDYEDEDDLERNIEAMSSSDMNIDMDMKVYMAQMDKELSRTTIGQSFETSIGNNAKKSTSKKAAEDDFDDIESFEPININVNTLKNMMDSYKSQIGGAGPVSNLLSAMGAGMSATTAVSEEVKDLTESTV